MHIKAGSPTDAIIAEVYINQNERVKAHARLFHSREFRITRTAPNATYFWTLILMASVTACDKQRPVPITTTTTASGAHKLNSVVRSDPTDKELIDAVKRAAAEETTTTTKYRNVQKTRFCTEMDVARDPYMPKNPELARCSAPGRPYRVMVQEPYPEVVKCPSVPDMASAWNVASLAENSWRVSTGGRSWRVSKISGGAMSAGAVIQLSNFTLSVESNHSC